jgi:cytochrome P450
MFTSITLFGIPILLCLLIYKHVLQPIFLTPLFKLPTPHVLCYISASRYFKDKHEGKLLLSGHERYGPIIRIGPKEVSVNSLEGLRKIYNTRGLEKHPWYRDKFQNYGTPNMVSMLDAGSHTVQKKMLSGVYAKSSVQNSGDWRLLSKKILNERFLPLIVESAQRGLELDVVSLGQWAGIDLMTAYLFGTACGTNFLRDDTGREEYFEEWMRFRDFDEIGEKKIVEGLCMKLLRDAVASGGDGPKAGESQAVVAPLLYSRLAEKAKADDLPLWEENLVTRCASEMLDHIIAAHETFAITLTYAVYQLSLDPPLQAALRFELSALDPPVQSGLAMDSLPQPDQMDALPLLDAILQETLRLYAAVPGRLPRIVPKGGMTIHDCFLPAGTTVSCNAYSLHRHVEAFPMPSEWLPQRWILGGQRLGQDNFPPPEVPRRWLWAFGSGGRMCIGSHYAVQALKLLIAAIYTGFETAIVDDEGIEQSDNFIAGPIGNKLIVRFQPVG